jgi:DNA-binding FrmR family transcriptional regulator
MKTTKRLNRNKKHALNISLKAQETLSRAVNMLKEGAYCPNVLKELDATFNLLKSAKKEVLNCHTHHCLNYRTLKIKQHNVV